MNNVNNMNIQIPIKEYKYWHALESAGFPTYLVGGAVRDHFCGIQPKDFDFATKAKPGEIHEIISKKFPKAKIDFVGASFGVMLIDGVEIATFRGDRYENTGSDKDVKIQYVDTIEEDLSRRDFQVNAMAMDIDGNLIDPFNGMSGIEDNFITFVGDADERIKEDATRIVRACRFIAKLGFAPSQSLAWAIHKNKESLKKVAPERLRVEIIKAMELESPSIFFGAMQWMGLLKIILPELSECYRHPGGKWHPETVWEHSMLVGDSLSKDDPVLRLAGFLHDIGKPTAWKEQNGKFINHHKIGEKILDVRLNELRFSKTEIQKIKGLTGSHMFFLSKLSPKAQRKLLVKLDSYDIDWRDLVRLRIADHKGNVAKDPMSISEIKAIVESFTQVEDTPRDTKSLAVSGGQLIKEFELVPGPVVGKLQKFLLDFSINTGIDSEDCLLLKSNDFFKEKVKI